MLDKKDIILTGDMEPAEYRRFLNEVRTQKDYIKIKNGHYASLNTLSNDMVNIEKIIPSGILCLYSAWHFYGMTTQVPDSFYIAIARARKVRLPSIPDITLVYQSPKLLDFGADVTTADSFNVRIYNRERCVCDAIKYRNKIGIDTMSEILNAYLKHDGRNLDKLHKYAVTLRVQTILKQYLEIAL